VKLTAHLHCCIGLQGVHRDNFTFTLTFLILVLALVLVLSFILHNIVFSSRNNAGLCYRLVFVSVPSLITELNHFL